jgi:hypothetical protein
MTMAGNHEPSLCFAMAGGQSAFAYGAEGAGGGACLVSRLDVEHDRIKECSVVVVW